MNTLHLKYAVEVERTGSITQAAENLYMAQPNLSKAVRELEDTLGITIFERTTKGVVPTQRGAEFLGYARNILAEIEKMESLGMPSDSGRQRFRISIPRGFFIERGAAGFIAKLLAEGGIDVEIEETDGMRTVAHVAERRFGLGILRVSPERQSFYMSVLADRELRHETIREYDVFALMSRRHPLAAAEHTDAEALRQYPEVAADDEAPPGAGGEQSGHHRPADTARRIRVDDRCSQYSLLARCPDAYMLSAPVPEEYLQLFELTQRIYRGADARRRELLVYPKGYRFLPQERSFLNYLNQGDGSLG